MFNQICKIKMASSVVFGLQVVLLCAQKPVSAGESGRCNKMEWEPIERCYEDYSNVNNTYNFHISKENLSPLDAKKYNTILVSKSLTSLTF